MRPSHLSFFSRGISSLGRRYISYSLHQVEESLRLAKIIKPFETYNDFLVKGNMITPGETVDDMWHRVASVVSEAGRPYYDAPQAQTLYSAFKESLSSFKVILSTPFCTNAGRHSEKSLSACAVPPIDFRKMNRSQLQTMIREYHSKGMGTGFNFDSVKDPAAVLRMLNQFAVTEVKLGQIERPVGNMGILSIDHPSVLSFAGVKLDRSVTDWKFNISINLTEDFMSALQADKPYQPTHGPVINPRELLAKLTDFTRLTGDPGIVFMHRYETSNKTPQLGEYVSLAPCGEVPLLNGEVCQFGYINLYAFINDQQIDYMALKTIVHQTVTLLDNAIEYSIQRLPTPESANVVSQIRKIGIGVCGFADMLMALGVPYESTEACTLAENILSFINYESKKASVELAKQRQPFPAFSDPRTKKERIIGPFLGKSSAMVQAEDWAQLNKDVYEHGIRNSSTVILPPTGRSALMGGVSTSIEPPFRLYADHKFMHSLRFHCERLGYTGSLEEVYSEVQKTGSVQATKLPDSIKAIYRTCLEISVKSHLEVTAVSQKNTDEAVSKTVNMHRDSSTEELVEIVMMAYQLGLKGISVYVDGTHELQPKLLSETAPMRNK